MAIDCLHLITGEYPPQPGGVADYTALLGRELAKAGADVHVWSSTGPETPTTSEVTVHRSAGRWSRADLRRLDAELDAFAPPRRLLVQYVPNAWGYKGMNLGFCHWLVHRRKRGDEIRVMFHEVWYQLERRDKPARWLLVLVQRLMARALMDACVCAYVSIPSWESLLRKSESSGRRPIVWLPVPSNVPLISDPDAVADVRRRLVPRGQTLLASFGTFGETIAAMLARIVPRLLQYDQGRVFLLLGRGGDRFASRLIAEHPDLAGRLISTGGLSPEALSIHLQACDLLIQPYPDGISSRRTSLMAGLAHGLAVVSNLGPRSEPLWGQGECLALAPEPNPEALIRRVESILAAPQDLSALRNSARTFYLNHFEITRTVETICGTPADVAV